MGKQLVACDICGDQHRQRGGRPLSDEEMKTALINKTPGAPPLTILSFSRAFHGRTMGLFSDFLW